MAATNLGPVKVTGGRDDDGYREYDVSFKIETDDYGDGPAVIMQTALLYAPGDPYAIGNDLDLWVWCRPGLRIEPLSQKDGEKVRHWVATQRFSNKPPTGRERTRCQDTPIEDPLLEPDKVSGTFSHEKEEATEAEVVTVGDRTGTKILTSSHEVVRGPAVEFDVSRPAVHIEQNRADLELDLLAQMDNTVNDSELWGLEPRTIKLKVGQWEEKLYGTCSRYFTRSFDFEIRYEGWDKDLPDEGTKVLNGHWAGSDTTGTGDDTGAWVLDNINGSPPDHTNPAHFIRAKDRNGENIKVLLDGYGRPFDANNETTGTGDDEEGVIHVEKYRESNFLLLGIPATIG